jgi:serine/threonine-protein kinase RsbW
VRAFVADRATARGLPAERVELLTLAISELVTNTLQHTGGGGRVQVLRDGGQVVCNVIDSAPATAFRLGRGMPAAEAMRGRGLAIVEQICDTVAVFPAAEGTRVEVRLSLP